MNCHNPFSLKGKIVLVTGASSGIGRACAIEIARAGATRIILSGRDLSRLKATAEEIGNMADTIIVEADLTDSEALENFVKEIPEIDGMVLSAGINRQKTVAFVKDSDLTDIFGVNSFLTFRLVGLLARKKKLRADSSIVLIGSISGLDNFSVGNAAYGASKQAATAFMKYAAVELAPKGIRCNVIHPGRIRTPLISSGIMEEKDIKKDIEKYPLKRYGHPEEVAYATVYFLSDAASWITGSELVVDGGRSLV